MSHLMDEKVESDLRALAAVRNAGSSEVLDREGGGRGGHGAGESDEDGGELHFEGRFGWLVGG